VVKWPGYEANHLSPSSAKVKSAWSYTSTPQICLHGMVLKAQGQVLSVVLGEELQI